MTQFMMDRVSQGAAGASAALNITAQRTLTAGQTTNLATELYTFYRMVEGLKVFSETYKAGQTQLIGTVSRAAMFCFKPTGDSIVNLAPGLTIEGGELIGGHFKDAWNPRGVDVPGSFRLVLNGQVAATRSLTGVQVLPYIYAIPAYMYRVFGGFIDEIASSVLRSDLSNMVVSPSQRLTLNRIVSGDLKGAVADIAKVQQGLGATVLMSGSVVAAKMAADADSLPIIRDQFPALYSALVLHEGIGKAVR